MTIHLLSETGRTQAIDAHTLGGAWLGEAAPAHNVAWPLQRVRAPLLGVHAQVPGLHEAWCVSAAVRSGEYQGIAWRRSGDVLYGVIELDEAAFATELVPALQAATQAAYARVFHLLDEQGLPHLWRVWNYMANIHGDMGTLERYRQFNLGRGDAFEQGERSVVGRVPAACALGVKSGPLSVAFLAGATPATPIENPRQVSAYEYPSDYGPRSPTFSRAALVYPPGQEWLFISGTASIVGHRSVHTGQLAAQCNESLDNVEAVLAQANQKAKGPPFALSDLAYRVYVRHATDVATAQSVLQQRVGQAPVVCVQADVCRDDLLVEVEAVGWRCTEP